MRCNSLYRAAPKKEAKGRITTAFGNQTLRIDTLKDKEYVSQIKPPWNIEIRAQEKCG